jgi:hypothetical protein
VVAFAALTNPAIEAVTAVLKGRGYQVVRTFDLQSALGHYVEDCPCPHHGTEDCTCQYVVLLAYPQAASAATAPRVLIAHSYGHMTQVGLQDDGSLADEERFALTSALVEAAMSLSPDQPIPEIWAGASGS